MNGPAKFVSFAAIVIALSSCGTSALPPLYYWGGSDSYGTTVYENLAYRDYKTQTPEALCQLICLYDDMVNHPGGSRQVPPPGICAEYGYLLLQPNTFSAFNERATEKQRAIFGTGDLSVAFAERGKEMIAKEMSYYPESKKLLEPLLKKLTGR